MDNNADLWTLMSINCKKIIVYQKNVHNCPRNCTQAMLVCLRLFPCLNVGLTHYTMLPSVLYSLHHACYSCHIYLHYLTGLVNTGYFSIQDYLYFHTSFSPAYHRLKSYSLKVDSKKSIRMPIKSTDM